MKSSICACVTCWISVQFWNLSLHIHLFLHLTTNFLNKLILHSFQFIIYTNIPHRILDYQQKRNFPFFNKGFQNFCVKLCYKHYKKIDLQFFNFSFTLYGGQFTFSTQFLTLNYLQFFVFTWHFFPLNWLFRQNHIIMIRTKLLHSFKI